MKKLTAALGLVLFYFSAFSQLHERRSLTTSLVSGSKGVASATVYLDYVVRRSGNEVWFNVSYSRIEVNAEAGYWHKGKLYKGEVPGLVELLRTGKCSYPKVKFDVYYGNVLQDTRTHQISARNNLSMLGGDQFTMLTTEDKLKNPAWRLEAVGMLDFNNVDWWYLAEDLIKTYEKGKKDQADYKALILDADAFFNQKNYAEALAKYNEASRHKLADAYPGQQLEKVKEALQKEKSSSRFEELMTAGDKAETDKNYTQALRQYETASRMGVDDGKASSSVNRVRRILNQIKMDEEEKLKNDQAIIEKKNKEVLDKLKKDKDEAERLLKEKDEKLQEEMDEKLEEEAKNLQAEEKKLFDENVKKQLQEQNDKWDQKKREEKQKEDKEKTDRLNHDNKLLTRFQNGMEWDPVKFEELRKKADGFFNTGMQLNPYAALELKKEWWDMNHFMQDFRDGLNEPRRQEAWQKCQSLLYDQESQFKIAKYYYMEAVQYTDKDSWHYNYLIGKMKQMNDLIDIQKSAIKLNQQGEEMRRQNFEEAKAWAVINRQRDNKLRAEMAYSRLRQQYIYPNHNYEGPDAGNAVQKQINYENRLNAADQQLKLDNAVTGATSQLAVGALMDENKTADPYGNGAMGINLFAFTGGASYPIVSNTEDNPDYVMASSADNLGVMPFTGGFDWWIRRAKVWDLALTGELTFGVLPIMGMKNMFFSYGGTAKLNVGYKAVKLALEADLRKRSGSYRFDEDVALQDNQFRQNTEVIYSGKFNYSVLRFGGGLHIQYSDEYEDGYLRLLVYAEKPSFYQDYSFSKPVTSFAIQWMMKGGFTLNGSYAKNYPVAGTAKYMMRTYSSRTHWGFSIGKIWTLGKTH